MISEKLLCSFAVKKILIFSKKLRHPTRRAVLPWQTPPPHLAANFSCACQGASLKPHLFTNQLVIELGDRTVFRFHLLLEIRHKLMRVVVRLQNFVLLRLAVEANEENAKENAPTDGQHHRVEKEY